MLRESANRKSATSRQKENRPILLYQSLVHHCVSYFEEARDVGAVYVVTRSAVLLRGPVTNFVDGLHNVVKTVIYFFAGQRNTHAVLRHFQSGSAHAASIGRFPGAKKNLRI